MSFVDVLLRTSLPCSGRRHWHSAQCTVHCVERERVDLRGLGLQLYDNEATDRTTRLYGEFESPIIFLFTISQLSREYII